jgi:hypothetical protein
LDRVERFFCRRWGDWVESGSWDTFPFLLDFRLEAGGDVVWFLEDSSVGREEGPGWDIAVRFRVPRRAAAGAAAGGGDAARRCLFALRGGEGGLECPGASVDRSVRAGAFRFRAGAEPAAEMGGEGPELTGGGSATSLAAERVTLAAEVEAPAEDGTADESSNGSWR